MSNILDIPQIAVFDPGNLQNDLHIGFTGDLKKQRLEKDRQRDVLWKEIKKTVDTFATLTIFPDKQEAALKMQPVMQKYAINPDGGIEAQTVATQQWLQEQQVNYQLELAAKALDIDSDDATRIVSTDKKALKAGGLLLALAGTPVQPADEVDAEKEYELVALA